MNYKPPFTITADILNLVADISQQVGCQCIKCFAAATQAKPHKTITGTLAIEGNTLTEAQITAIVEGKPVSGSVRELAEVKGAIAAYEALPDYQPVKLDDLLAAHGLMMAGNLTNTEVFRSKAVGIHKSGKVHHVAPPVHR